MIYFIRAQNGNGPIKIGVAKDVQQRLSILNTASPRRLCVMHSMPGSYAIERRLHAMFAHDRTHGEWFHPGPSLRAFISNAKRKREDLMTPEQKAIMFDSYRYARNEQYRLSG